MEIINKSLNFGNMTYGNVPKMLIVHHLEAEGQDWTVEKIHIMHKTEKQFLFAGIGYHYYIRLDGSVFKGRPDNAIGAHCQGCNTNTIGIAFEGDYDKRTVMPDAQFNAWCELKAYLENKYGSIPVFGHKEKGSSECPGKYFPLENVKSGINKSIGKWIPEGDKWWYKHNDGSYTSSGWEQIEGEWYYFDSNGYMVTGWVYISKEDKYYYCYDDGKMAHDCELWGTWKFDSNGVGTKIE